MIVPLTSTTPATADHLGGKAIGLLRLLRAGLPVPAAWVIPVAVARTDAGRVAVRGELAEWWMARAVDYPEARWAVRSSAVAEDLADASFAGVYETVLGNATFEQLLEAVEHCWDAAHGARAEAYRAGGNHAGASGIALILQRQVEAEVSGVLLTANPLHPFRDELVINAGYGLGEAVVSGLIDPDLIVLDRTKGVPLRTTVGAKQLELVTGGAGPDTRAVPDDRRGRLSLSEHQIARLAEVAALVEQRIGPNRDLEWTFQGDALYVLQDRPITAIPSRTPSNVWSRRFGDEYLADYSSPLGQRLWQWISIPLNEEMVQMMGRGDLLGGPVLRDHQGYAYISGNYCMELLRSIPRRIRPASLLAWFTDDWRAAMAATPGQSKYFLGLPLAHLRDRRRAGLERNLRVMREHCEQVERIVGPWLNEDLTALTEAEWLRQYRAVDELGLAHFRVIRWGMGVYLPILHSALESLLRGWADDADGTRYQDIIGGLPGTHTGELNTRIRLLAAEARADATLMERLLTGMPYDELRACTPDSCLWAEFDAFLAESGHRGTGRDVALPRWREQPEVVFGLVAAQVYNNPLGDKAIDPDVTAHHRRERTERRCLESAGRGPAGVARRALLRRLIRITQAYTVYRENQRYHLDYLITHLRALALEQGRRLVDRSILTAADDVFLLTAAELESLATPGETVLGTTELAERISDRGARRQLHSGRQPPLYLYDDIPTDGPEELPETATSGADLEGTGVSAGLARGHTRTVHSLADLAQVRTGDILIATNIDPGWTSVFPMLSGVITQTGGLLSHAAILAREYGIPTVTGIADATTKLPTGILIEIDGTNGTITILDIDLIEDPAES